MENGNYDLIVAGSGAGGMAAALTAAGRGLSVCLLEKGSEIGGGTATSYGSLWAPQNALAAQAGLADSLEDGLAYARYVAGGAEIPESLETHVRAAPRAVAKAQPRVGHAKGSASAPPPSDRREVMRGSGGEVKVETLRSFKFFFSDCSDERFPPCAMRAS